MAFRPRLFGHPAHPPFTHLPLALWLVSPLLDLAGLRLNDPFWWKVSWACQAAGLVASVPAVATGFLEFLAIPKDHPAGTVATFHLSVMGAAACFFLGSLVARGPFALGTPPNGALALGLSAAGALAVSVGGWLGGHLVYRHRIGVDPSL